MALKLLSDDDRLVVLDTDLVADGDKETSYTVRHLTAETHRAMVKARTTKVPNKRTHQRDDVTDWDGVSDDLIDYVLESWTGVEDRGASAPCDREHKLRLDSPRKTALLEKAGMNEILAAPERRAESFRAPESVR